MHLKPKILEKIIPFFKNGCLFFCAHYGPPLSFPKSFFSCMGSSFLLLYQFSSVYFMSRGRLDLVAAKCSFSLILCENCEGKNVFTSPLKISSHIYKHKTLCKDKRIFLLHLECLYTTGACCFSFKLSIG